MLEVCITYLVDTALGGEFMGEILELASKVNESLADNLRTTPESFFVMVRGGMSLSAAISKTKADCFMDGTLDTTQAVESKAIDEVRVLIHKMQANIDQLSENEASLNMVAKMKVLHKEGIELLSTIGEALKESAAAALQKSVDDLRDIAKGVSGGKDWLNNFPEGDMSNYKKLAKRAAETLSKEPQVANMKVKIDAVRKACQCGCHPRPFFVRVYECVGVCSGDAPINTHIHIHTNMNTNNPTPDLGRPPTCSATSSRSTSSRPPSTSRPPTTCARRP